MNRFRFIVLLIAMLGLSGCDFEHEDEDENEAQGWHFQGRDCLACHNSDLGSDKRLTLAGTLFKEKNVSDVNEINQLCGGELVLKLLDSSGNIIYRSDDYIDEKSNGTLGKGNMYILSRQYAAINGDYYIQISDSNNTLFASSLAPHSFTDEYRITDPQSYSNRHSCNACHSAAGTASLLYAKTNGNLCQ